MIVEGQDLPPRSLQSLGGKPDTARGLDKSGRDCQTMPESAAELNKRFTRQTQLIDYHPIQRIDRMTGDGMSRWRRLWLSVKLVAAAAACVAVAVQAFLYMLDSQDAVQIHPLSIMVAGLIFGFVSYGLLSLIERGVKRLVARFDTAAPEPQAELEADVELTLDEPLTPLSDAPVHQKNL